MKLAGWSALFVLIIAPTVTIPAAAAEITRKPQANGPDVITIHGVIEAGDYWKFIEITRNIKQASVILNSRGGSIGQAIHIGRLIRDRNYETRVRDGAVCDSACSFIWLAGTSRHLDRRARLGFHSASKPNASKPSAAKPNQRERNERGNAIAAAYMASLGVPQQVIELQPKADPCCLNYIDYAQAKAWGLLSDRSAKQQALPTPETQLPAATAPASPKLPAVPVTTLPEPVPASSAPAPGLPSWVTGGLGPNPAALPAAAKPAAATVFPRPRSLSELFGN